MARRLWLRRGRGSAVVVCTSALVAVLASGLVPSATAASAIAYGITPTSGPPGTLITYSGTGCSHTDAGGPGRDGAFVLVTLPTGNFAQQTQSVFTSGSDGTFTGAVSVPQDLAPGVYDTGISCYDGGEAGWPYHKGGVTFTVTPGPPALTFASNSLTVQEDVATATVAVARRGDSSAAVTVDYAATAGTATVDTDFSAISGTLSFGAGETSKTFEVPVLPDALAEGRETIQLTLSNPTGGASLLNGGTSTLTIATSDQQPDAQVSTAASSGFIGDDLYNSTAAGQTKTVSARRTRTKNFYVRVQNDGNATDTVTVRGSRATSGSSVQYYAGTTTKNLTTALRSAKGLRVSLAPGARKLIRIQLKVSATAAIGSRKSVTVSGSWTGDGVRADVAKATVKVVS